MDKMLDNVKKFDEEIMNLPRFSGAKERRDWVMAKLEEDMKDPEFANMTFDN